MISAKAHLDEALQNAQGKRPAGSKQTGETSSG